MAIATASVEEVCAGAKRAARSLATLDTLRQERRSGGVAQALQASTEEILDANRADVAAGREAGLSPALLDRLALDERRIAAMAAGVREIAALPDPVGELLEEFRRPNGLQIRKLRVPLGVVAVVYEARPNVTIDAAALCLKSGNAVVLRGSSSAARSNAVLAADRRPGRRVGRRARGRDHDLAGGDRDELVELATQTRYVDLIIPRGGEGLKAALLAHATVPVIYAASGNCHVYVDAGADLEQAHAIALNAKVQRPGCLQRRRDAARAPRRRRGSSCPARSRRCATRGVELRGDQRTREYADGVEVAPASAADWDSEYLALTLAVGVVDSLDDAIEHIAAHGTGHSEAIVTRDEAAARRFQLEVDAACVYVNASTRFTDGGEFGMGAEIGNSTQKLHARGPIGLRELCACKYLVEGDGHVRS